MNVKTRAKRAGSGGSSNVVLAVDTEGNTPAQALRQALFRSRYGCSPATAALMAELAFPSLDTWRASA
ncbi:hypothetical protein [Methylobacterium sp. A54F]